MHITYYNYNCIIIILHIYYIYKTNFVALSPQANYTD
jgi:hypothetical protein